MLDDTIENLRGMIGFVQMAKNPKYPIAERNGFLMFAVMHACQAAIHGDGDWQRYGMSIHDYKHVLIKAAKAIMNGKGIDEVMSNVPVYPLASSIDWNYLDRQTTTNRD